VQEFQHSKLACSDISAVCTNEHHMFYIVMEETNVGKVCNYLESEPSVLVLGSKNRTGTGPELRTGTGFPILFMCGNKTKIHVFGKNS
jgi:hypothetical protein